MVLALVTVLVGAAPAVAQSHRIYAGGSAGVSGGSRGPVVTGSVFPAGVLAGLRISEAWSVEIEADRGFAAEKPRTTEGTWLSLAARGAPFEEVERLAVRARFVRSDRPGAGLSAHIVWKSREPGRLNAAFYGGVSQRRFYARTIRTITHVPDAPEVPVGSPGIRDADETRRITGGGLTGGAMVLIDLGGAITLAPEFRFTAGLITDESTYKNAQLSLRLMWGLTR
jgi:hypothetical protein